MSRKRSIWGDVFRRRPPSPPAICLLFSILLVSGCGKPAPSDNQATFPGASVSSNSTSPPWFQESGTSSGVIFTHEPGHSKRFYLPEMITGGVGLLDYDNDGLLDIYGVNGGSIEPKVGSIPGHRLFRNLGGWKFEDVTDRAGVRGNGGYGMGCACGDFDQDGFTDIFVTQLSGGILYRNNRDGTFADVTRALGFDDKGWGISAAFCDIDLDGDLDLFVTHYIQWSPATELSCFSRGGRPDYCSPMNYKAPAMDALYENRGKAGFANITLAAGLDKAYGNGLGVVCADFTGDGLPDLFVANDAMPNQLWVNQGKNRFKDEAPIRGCAVSAVGMSRAGMGVAAVDFRNRGVLDLFVTHLVGEGNGVFLNAGGYFTDFLAPRGANASSRPWTGFGVGFADFDNDGHLDVFVANGRVKHGAGDLDARDPYAEPNSLLRGIGNGEFEEVQPSGVTLPVLMATSRGAAVGDLDNDGGVDVVVVNRDGPMHLLRNIVPARGNWATLRVLDRNDSDAVNARVAIEAGGVRQYRDVLPNQSYCSSHDARVHFGIGRASRIDRLEVRWPTGQCESFPPVEPGRVHVLRQGSGKPVPSIFQL